MKRTQHETTAKKFDFKKRWPIAAAAVALLAIAGAGIPAVRQFGGADQPRRPPTAR
jgi:hypothetical protein